VVVLTAWRRNDCRGVPVQSLTRTAGWTPGMRRAVWRRSTSPSLACLAIGA
jgi:hypothetical protein